MEQLVNFIIRPPRADYSPKHDLLDQEFMLRDRWFQRKDLEVVNSRGNTLKCSHYMPLEVSEGKMLPCVIYCHGNSGCRADASEAAIILLPSNITVFTLDFSGSGLSEGEHVTLGWNEKDDLRAVVNHLRTDGNISCIGLWGRSMGAVTSLMYGAEDPSIAGMVLDSPFSNLVELMMELVDTYKYPLPKFTVKLAIQHMRRVIKKKANFDIMDLDAIQAAKSCFVPALFGHATDDDFIQPHHSDRIYDSYVGDKNIIKFDGDHNSPRPQFYFHSITIFFHNVLNPPKNESDEQYFQTMHSLYDKDNWDAGHELEYRNKKAMESPPEIKTSSTEEAINQLRIRRPMSRTEVPHDISPHQKNYGAEGKGSDHDLGPSSSKRYIADLPNANPHSLDIPNSEDDEYVEYSFDTLSDIPCTTEDEERMIMEAIIESLKDLDTGHKEEDVQSNLSNDSPDSADAAITSSSRHKSNGPPGTGSKAAVEERSGTLDFGVGVADNSAGNDRAFFSASSSVSGSSSAQDADTTANTRATLVVQKNPASNVLDGLSHRWGLFFRNAR